MSVAFQGFEALSREASSSFDAPDEAAAQALPDEPRCLAAALDYQRRGFSVVAAHAIDPNTGQCTCRRPNCDSPGKHTIGGWLEAQEKRRTAAAVRALFKKHPYANVGIIAGNVSGVAVLDIDGPEGEKGVQALVDAGILTHEDVTTAPRSKSGRIDGGHHLWFRLSKDGPQGRLTPKAKLDLLAKGLVIMPPSRHASGNAYSWVRRLDDAPLTQLPEGLATMLRGTESPAVGKKDQTPAPGATINARKYVEQFIEYLADPARSVEGVGARDTMLAQHIVPMGKALGLSEDCLIEIVEQNWWGAEGRCPVTDGFDFDAEVRRKYRNLTGTRPGEKQSFAEDVAVGLFQADELPALPCYGETQDVAPAVTAKGASDDTGKWTARPYDRGRADKLPPRPWVVKGLLLSRTTAALIAPGGVGKSTLSLLFATAISTGRGDLIGQQVCRQGPVWIINNEDDEDELDRRMRAIEDHFDIRIGPDVFTNSGTDGPYKVAIRSKDGQIVPAPDVDRLESEILRRHIVTLIVDPLVSTHSAAENSNDEMDEVMRIYNGIAKRTNIAVLVIPHTNKPQGASAEGRAGDMNSARGATAIVNAVRIAYTLYDMTRDEAKGYGVAEDQRHLYARLDNAKSNYTLRSGDVSWFRKGSVTVPGGESVGVFSVADLAAQADNASLMILYSLLPLLLDGDRAQPHSLNSAAAKLQESDPEQHGDTPLTTLRRKIEKALREPQEVDGWVISLEERSGGGSQVRKSIAVEKLSDVSGFSAGAGHE